MLSSIEGYKLRLKDVDCACSLEMFASVLCDSVRGHQMVAGSAAVLLRILYGRKRIKKKIVKEAWNYACE